MGLNIVVCIKRTPSSTSAALDASGRVKIDGMPHAINPFDEYALEEGLRIKERVAGSKVTAVTAGTPEALEVIRAALAVGADEGVVLSDPSFAGTCTLGTSHLLAQAVKKLAEANGAATLVLFGKQTNDGESGHITASVGAWLGWPSVNLVRKVAEVSESEITVERPMEDGVDTLKLKVPAVFSVTKEINEPRLPSLRGKMAAKKKQIPQWGAADLQADATILGTENSPTQVVKMEPVPARPLGTVINGETPEEKAKNLVAALKEAKFI